MPSGFRTYSGLIQEDDLFDTHDEVAEDEEESEEKLEVNDFDDYSYNYEYEDSEEDYPEDENLISYSEDDYMDETHPSYNLDI